MAYVPCTQKKKAYVPDNQVFLFGKTTKRNPCSSFPPYPKSQAYILSFTPGLK
ncbi:hypothetical protein RchiOBHm_Chr7g0221451 [Rosa chinensis]|uniref:Uncharacterized protein n=1 Tax=Rosa chinensis TaxID=74649 RepID=A0A2P6PD19_ROSCH|nr:hypothetical protein RchiOBHm_Chr7g0221451 [Rosa chinensis]